MLCQGLRIICAIYLIGLCGSSAWPQSKPAEGGASAPTSKSKSTVYTFEAEDLMGKGKGPNNVFLKVGKMKNRKLLEMRPNFRPELRNSLRLVK